MIGQEQEGLVQETSDHAIAKVALRDSLLLLRAL